MSAKKLYQLSPEAVESDEQFEIKSRRLRYIGTAIAGLSGLFVTLGWIPGVVAGLGHEFGHWLMAYLTGGSATIINPWITAVRGGNTEIILASGYIFETYIAIPVVLLCRRRNLWLASYWLMASFGSVTHAFGLIGSGMGLDLVRLQESFGWSYHELSIYAALLLLGISLSWLGLAWKVTKPLEWRLKPVDADTGKVVRY